MYNLIIADDEPNIILGIKKYVDWKSCGFKIVKTATSGEEVIDYIKSHSVDAVLTDINMPNKSGLDIAKYIYENSLDIKIVLLTGYGEFEYAKSAITYGVSSYLSKPTSPSELATTFGTIKKQLDNQKSKDLSPANEDNFNLELKQFFFDISIGAIKDKDEIKNNFKKFGLHFDIQNSRVTIIKVSSNISYNNEIIRKYSKGGFCNAFYNFAKDEVSELFILQINQTSTTFQFIILHNLTNEKINIFTENIQKKFLNILNVKIQISVSADYNDIFEFANEHYKKLLFSSKNIFEHQSLLISYIIENNKEASLNMIQALLLEISKMELSNAKTIVTNLFSVFSYKLNQSKSDIQYLQLITSATERVMLATEFSQIEKIVNEIIEIMFDVLSNNQAIKYNYIDKAKEYISQNYNQDISLEDIASLIYLSPTYFGQLFKKETNETFTDYLIKYRINKACELLANPQYKIYDICEKVGYQTPRYFYRIFKQITGYTPSEYRNNLK